MAQSYDISVVTICYNHAKGFDATAQSLLKAKEKAPSSLTTEWIVIDGGSNTETTDVQIKYAEHMAYYVTEKDGGIYPAMNKGLKQSHGKYVVFMNAGDELTENALDLVSNAMEEHSQSNLIYGGYRTRNIYRQPKDIDNNKIAMFCCHQSMYFDLELLNKNNLLYREDYKSIADLMLIRSFIPHIKEYTIIPEALCIFEGGGTCETKPFLAGKEHFKYRRELGIGLGKNLETYVKDTLIFNTACMLKKTCSDETYDIIRHAYRTITGKKPDPEPPASQSSHIQTFILQ